MRWLRFVLVSVGIVAAVAPAVVPTSVVFKTGSSSQVTFDCGAPVTHAFGGINADEVPVVVFPGYAVPKWSCREQSRIRLGLAGGVTVIALGAGYLALQRRPEEVSVTA